MEKLKYIFDNAKVGIAICNAQDNRLEMVNPAFAHIHGYEPHELIGVSPGDVFAPECMLRLEAQGNTPSCDIDDVSFETTHFKKDGSRVPVAVHITVIKDESGVVKQRIANIQDISERKILNESNDFYHEIFDNSIDPIYLIKVTPKGRFIHLEINPAFFNAVGVAKEEIVGRYVDELEDEALRTTLIHKYQACLDADRKIEYISEFDLPIGHRIYHSTLSPIRDESGRIYKIAGIARDITDKINKEKKLKQSEEKLSNLFQISPLGIALTNMSGEYLEFNEAFCKICGYSADELKNLDYWALTPIEYKEQEAEQLDSIMRTGRYGPYEKMYHQKNGNLIPIQLTGVMVKGDNGEEYIWSIIEDISERKNVEKKIEFMAHHDALTELPNRILAKDRMQQAIAHAKRNNNKAALMFIDLDGFKTINDSLGHAVGDAMLKSVSLRLSESIRETDTLSRQGGDEFLLILPDINNRNDIVAIADKLIQAFEKPFQVNNHVLSTSASIGIAVYPTHGDSFESLIQCADAAMYKAKELGKNAYCFYSIQMNHNRIGQFKLQNDLKSAIQKNEFILHYQPQVNIINHRITGVEALIRWNHPQLGLVPPMSFISIAESSGLIIPIGEWVIMEACRQGALWHSQGMEITIAVNISAVQFKRGNLEEVVKNALSSSGLNPRFLELELTESIMMHNVEKTLQTVRILKSLDVQLSIDDFGTGYSSLAYLKRFAVNKLKIDQSFIRDLLNDQEDAIIVSTIIQMAKSLNLQTIAEGVENAEVLRIVQGYGCDEVQGYHFAKPMEAADFEEYHACFAKTQ